MTGSGAMSTSTSSGCIGWPRQVVREHEHQHGRERAAQVGEPEAEKVLPPDGERGLAPIEADGRRDEPGAHAEVEHAEERQQGEQAGHAPYAVDEHVRSRHREERL